MARLTVTTNTQEQTLTDKTLVDPIIIGGTINDDTSVTAFGAKGDGATDDTAAIQAALDSGATEVHLPQGTYKTTSTLFLRQTQALVGVARPNRGLPTRFGSSILFRPTAGSDTCISNVTDVTGQSVRDVEINLDGDTHVGIGFEDSYANTIRNVQISGTFDVGIYLHNTFVCEVDTIAMTGVTAKRYLVYLGATNGTVVRRLHSSVSAIADVNTPVVGVGLRNGRGNSIENCVFQGMTIGISLQQPRATVIMNPYYENCVCNIRTGDPTLTSVFSRGTTVIGGTFAAITNTENPHYSKRGPLVYLPNTDYVQFLNCDFGSSNATDSATWPFLVKAGKLARGIIQGVQVASSDIRDEVFRETAAANPLMTIIGSLYDAFSASEVILKKAGAFNGGEGYGVRVASDGTLSTTSWQGPVISGSVDAILDGAFIEPTLP